MENTTMTNRITQKDLEAVCKRINMITGNALKPYFRNEEGKLIANIGNYHIDGAYGGVALHQMQNEAGGIRDVLGSGHVSKRELYNRMQAFIRGLESKS